MVLKVEKLVGLLTPLLESDQLNSKTREVLQKWIFTRESTSSLQMCCVHEHVVEGAVIPDILNIPVIPQ